MKKMRHFILLITFIISAIFYSQAQNKVEVTDNNSSYSILDQSTYKCTYDYKYQTDSLDKGSGNSAYMVLLIGNQYNTFISEFRYHIDSLLFLSSKGLVSEEQISNGFTQYTPGGPKYTIITKNNTHKTKMIYPTTQGVWETNDSVSMKWQLGQASDSINGYYCRNAFTNFRGRKYTAWYAPEIPLPFGPYKFSGLPGIIVKISDQQKSHIFELKGMQKNQFDMFIKNTKTIKMNQKQLKKAIRNYKLGLIEKAKMWFAHDPNKVERYSKKILSENNPIEL